VAVGRRRRGETEEKSGRFRKGARTDREGSRFRRESGKGETE
jgi:hypothetical protein